MSAALCSRLESKLLRAMRQRRRAMRGLEIARAASLRHAGVYQVLKRLIGKRCVRRLERDPPEYSLTARGRRAAELLAVLEGG